MNDSRRPRTNVHSPSTAQTRTLVANHPKSRTVEYHTFSSHSAAETPVSLPHCGPEARPGKYHGMHVPPDSTASEVARASSRTPTRTQEGGWHASSRYRQSTNGEKRSGGRVAILQRPSDPTKTSSSVYRTVAANPSTPNIPPGSRIDQWREGVARANPFAPCSSSPSLSQRSGASISRSFPQYAKTHQSQLLVDPKRHREYVYGPSDEGASEADTSADGSQSQLQGGPLGPYAHNGTPYPRPSGGHKYNCTASRAGDHENASASGLGETDPSEY